MDLTGNELKLVSYSVIYVQRDFEATLQQERSEIVSEDTTAKAFSQRKIAEFLVALETGLDIPQEWRNGAHPPGDFGYFPDTQHPASYSRIPQPKYIGVSMEVTSRISNDSTLDKQPKSEVLDEIRRQLDEKP